MPKKNTKKTLKKSVKKPVSSLLLVSVASVVVLVSALIGSFLYFNHYFGPQNDGVSVVAPMTPAQVDARRDKIESIYDSLKLGSDYTLVSQNVFGQKKQYAYDSGRTFSSEKDYTRDASVDVTVADLKQKIETAGFAYFEEPYPNSVFKEFHFKSTDGHYIRLNVSSKPMNDYVRAHKELGDEYYKMDANAGPSDIVIKVNLDDNNE